MSGHRTDIATFTGGYFDFVDLESNVFSIEDIAQGLSNVCRFGGQCPRFYSVAQHSALVYRLLRDVLDVDSPTIFMQGLLHDGTEAFLGDMVTPLKRMLPAYGDLERRLQHIIMAKFGLPPDLHPLVRKADLMALSIEKRELLRNRDDWVVLEGVETVEWSLIPAPPTVARAMFIAEYNLIGLTTKTAA
jgi:hypothetical protein